MRSPAARPMGQRRSPAAKASASPARSSSTAPVTKATSSPKPPPSFSPENGGETGGPANAVRQSRTSAAQYAARRSPSRAEARVSIATMGTGKSHRRPFAIERSAVRRSIVVNDRMQQNYQYELVEPTGRNFDPYFCPH